MWVAPSVMLAACALIDLFSARISVSHLGYLVIFFWCPTAMVLMLWRYLRFETFDWFLHRLWGAMILFLWINYTTNTVALFCHMLFAQGYPLIDSQLLAADLTLGFHWNAYAHFMFDNYWPNLIFSNVYADLTMSVMMLTPIIALIRNDRIRVMEICFLMLGTAIVCVTISGIFPSFPTTATIPDGGILNAMETNGHHYLGRVIATINSLRDAPFVEIDPRTTEGIVTFPSFHCCMALIIMRCNRGLGLFSAVASAIGIAIILATPVYGGHYLSDLLGGSVATLFFIWVWDTYFAKRVSPVLPGTSLNAYDLPAFFKRFAFTTN